MINLIPKDEKKKMARGFYYKLVVLFLAMASASILILLVAILPSYFLSNAKFNIVNAKLEKQKSEPVPLPDQATLAVIKDLKNKLNLIELAEQNKFTVSQKVITAIIRNKMPAIKITDIFYENSSNVSVPLGRKISIRGVAPSREVLLLFRLALENDTEFKQVDLPISNFVKGSNIEFFLSVIPA
jgi:hypothetical protein